jgi:hypothetical protein
MPFLVAIATHELYQTEALQIELLTRSNLLATAILAFLSPARILILLYASAI